MRRLLIGVATMLAVLGGGSARAAIFTYVVTGTVVGDSSEGGAAFGDIVLGRDFSARFEVDDALPSALYAASASGSSAQGGGLIQDGTRPPVRAVLTINGMDYAIRTGDKDVPPYCDPVIGCIGPSARIDDAGTIVKDAGARRLDLSAGYEDFDSCCADYNSYYSIATDDLRFTLNGAAFAVADYRQTGTFALSGTGSFVTVYRAGDRSGGVSDSTRLSFAPTALTVSGGVPEPATWAMTILGFGIVGAALRRRRVVVAA
ncbi:PEPxxWA-CTERM sorting domain-containing protein [Sphingomonas endophytica]|uniref:Ice-binding protein C-terminal domain-containing protein n=1 Tax=Sphingomonas endophytica TaxID=869719 RepID=A0A147I1J2_9SPHN|nr:PEPxxWA-CTERM sorting domain-containing protein [Sphingomonas endophytica]KTT71398.1 hypothetical protein NS334_10515 [Sphingomonas endophytica]